MNFMIKPATAPLLDSYLPRKTKVPRDRRRVEQKSYDKNVGNCWKNLQRPGIQLTISLLEQVNQKINQTKI
jgi:hypothetical protein